MAQHVKFIVSANEAYLVVFTARDNVHLVLPVWPMYRVLNAWRMSLCTNVFTSSLPLCFFFCLSSLPPSPCSLPPSFLLQDHYLSCEGYPTSCDYCGKDLSSRREVRQTCEPFFNLVWGKQLCTLVKNFFFYSDKYGVQGEGGRKGGGEETRS